MSHEHVHPIFRGILNAIAPHVPESKTDFACRVCGVECPISPADGSGAVCEAHCPDHQFVYQGAGDGHRCRVCFAYPPYDHFDD